MIGLLQAKSLYISRVVSNFYGTWFEILVGFGPVITTEKNNLAVEYATLEGSFFMAKKIFFFKKYYSVCAKKMHMYLKKLNFILLKIGCRNIVYFSSRDTSSRYLCIMTLGSRWLKKRYRLDGQKWQFWSGRFLFLINNGLVANSRIQLPTYIII